MVPHPVHWKRPPQSPVAQWPVPLALKAHPVRPQNRLFQCSGTVIVTLCPTGRTQPVAASGCLASGAAATQIVWLVLLTNVTSRAPPDAAGPAVAELAVVGPAAGPDRVGDADKAARLAEDRAVAGFVAVGRWPGVAGCAGAPWLGPPTTDVTGPPPPPRQRQAGWRTPP